MSRSPLCCAKTNPLKGLCALIHFAWACKKKKQKKQHMLRWLLRCVLTCSFCGFLSWGWIAGVSTWLPTVPKTLRPCARGVLKFLGTMGDFRSFSARDNTDSSCKCIQPLIIYSNIHVYEIKASPFGADRRRGLIFTEGGWRPPFSCSAKIMWDMMAGNTISIIMIVKRLVGAPFLVAWNIQLALAFKAKWQNIAGDETTEALTVFKPERLKFLLTEL